MGFPRSSGVLLHLISLPGRFGIGEMGREARLFVDFLKRACQSFWQVLPLVPTGYGNSPYQGLSAFAGNPLLISLERLVEDGFLEATDLKNAPLFPEHYVDYRAVVDFKKPLLKKSFILFQERAGSEEGRRFEVFCRRNAFWLEDYSLFMALKEAHGFSSWNSWDEDIRRREPKAIRWWRDMLRQEILYYKYEQYLFFRQWFELKRYCNRFGIRIIGDIPLFVALDSADVWAHQEVFYLDDEGRPTVVAGVPPDYFSKTGQLWGNPLYRWDVIAKGGYIWWVERIKAMCVLVDVIRLDHFRGFEKYWEVPAEETTAMRGRWVLGPGMGLFKAVEKALGALPPIIAEDLGVITPEVEKLREGLGFPGMRVLQFAFDEDAENKHKPHNYTRNCVVYTGTHDNNTVLGWFRGEDVGDTTQSGKEREKERRLALRYLGTRGREINWDFIRLAMGSVADLVIIPLQDILGLGGEARMNCPGREVGNWRWRFTFDMLTKKVERRLRELTALYGRAQSRGERI